MKKTYKYPCDTCGRKCLDKNLRTLRLFWQDFKRKYHNRDGSTLGRQFMRHDVSRYVCARCIKKIVSSFMSFLVIKIANMKYPEQIRCGRCDLLFISQDAHERRVYRTLMGVCCSCAHIIPIWKVDNTPRAHAERIARHANRI